MDQRKRPAECNSLVPKMLRTLALCAVPAVVAACARAPIAPVPETFSSSDRLVGTYYFYWYKYPGEHFFDDRAMRDDALTDHFLRPRQVDYESVEWHWGEFRDMAWCGVDFLLPVYWGAPGAYDRGHGIFSVRGLDAMQEARDRMLARGEPCPRIGMFYDTSTLLNWLRGDTPPRGKPDLRTPHGKDVFYGTIRDYWQRLDRRHWAMIDGRPLTVLYGAGFAAGFDQSTFDHVYDSFERDFGVRPYIIADASWRPARVEGYYRWGAALTGPNIDDVAAVGPGYDDRAVPGRSTPIRDREMGGFYDYSWLAALQSGRRIVLIETWNEMHEGTDICRSVEYWWKYLRLTRKWVRRFKAGEAPETTITLKYRNPLPRGPTNEGREFAGARDVLVDFAAGIRKGLRIVGQSDGRFERVEAGGRRCVRSVPSRLTYLYFAVPDPFYFGLHEPVEIEVDYFDGGEGDLTLQYDSHDEDAPHAGAYTIDETIRRQGSGKWVRHVFRLENAAFLSRQNHATDFRFAVTGDPVCVSRVSVKKAGKTR